MYLCSYKRDFQINGRMFYNDLCIGDIQSFAEFYVENEAIVIDKVGSNASDLNFWLKLTDALNICKKYVPEHNAKRVLLKLQRYRRLQLKEIESGYYSLRDRVKELETELDEQKKLAEAAKRDDEKTALADAFLQSDNCVTAREFNVILRQNGIANHLPTAVFRGMERLGWIDNSGSVKHVPTPFGIDNGYVRLVQDVQHPRVWQYAPLMITAKGQQELLKYYKKMSNKSNTKPQYT